MKIELQRTIERARGRKHAKKNKILFPITLYVAVNVVIVMASACSPVAASIPSVPQETATSTIQPPAEHIVRWDEFGQAISLSDGSGLSAQVTAQTVPAVPMSDQIIFSEAHPVYVQMRFDGYQNGRPFELPVFPFAAQGLTFG